MKNHIRRISFAALVGSAALWVAGPLDAKAPVDLCEAAGCSKGDRKCAELHVTVRDERCEEGVMCCPFPEESWVEMCREPSRET